MSEAMRVLDLFSGIGGFSLGLERAGMHTVAFCEIDPFCRSVLKKHWPDVPCYEDIRTLSADALSRDGIAVDVICGGFPCQDLSFAGKRAGLEGARSGLWGEYARLIGELRPRFVIVENVPGLLSLGMGRVLGDLSALGYDATWDCIPASAVGAPHRRDRVWIVAHRARLQPGWQEPRAERERAWAGGQSGHDANADRESKHARAVDAEVAGAPKRPAPDALGDELRQQPGRISRKGRAGSPQPREHGAARAVADADKLARHEGRPGNASQGAGRRDVDRGREQSAIRDANVSGLAIRQGQSRDVGQELAPAIGADWWLSEPDVGRVAHGVPARVDRLRSLGNSVVPQVVEIIGKAIVNAYV